MVWKSPAVAYLKQLGFAFRRTDVVSSECNVRSDRKGLDGPVNETENMIVRRCFSLATKGDRVTQTHFDWADIATKTSEHRLKSKRAKPKAANKTRDLLTMK